jgi:hypothetical protein
MQLRCRERDSEIYRTDIGLHTDINYIYVCLVICTNDGKKFNVKVTDLNDTELIWNKVKIFQQRFV